MKTPTRFILALAGSALVVAGLPTAAQADDVNTVPMRSTAEPVFASNAEPFSVAVLPDGSRILVGTVPNVGAKIVSLVPGPNAGQFTRESTILGNKHHFGSAVGLAFDSSKRLWMTDASGPYGPSVNSYAAGFGPGITDDSEVSPRLTIMGNYTVMHDPSEALVTKSGEIVVTDLSQDKVFIYPANTGGNIRPARYIQDGIATPFGAALDGAGQIYVANNGDNSITIYPANASSSTGPTRTIKGPNTQLNEPRKIAVDTSNNIYVTNAGSDSVVVFAAGANGNVAPVKRIVGASTQLNNPAGIALDAERRVYVVNMINSGVGDNLVQFPTLMPFKVPAVARAMKVSGSSKSKTRTVSWSAPANNGGTPVTRYKVVVKKGSKTLYSKFVTGRSFKMSRSKLKSGTNTAYVYAYNRIGSAPAAKKSFTVKK